MNTEQLDISNPRRSYALIIISNIVWVFALYLYFSFMSLYLRDVLGANPVELGIYQSFLALNLLIWSWLGGPLTTRFGEKPILILAWALIAPAPLIYLISPTWHWTLVGAAFEGTAMLGAAPVASYINRLTGSQRRGLAHTIVSSSTAIGGIPSPVIGGFLITWFGYSLTFLLASTLFSLSAIILLPISSVLRDTKKQEARWFGDFLANRVFQLTTLMWVAIISLIFIAGFFVPLYLKDHFGLLEIQIGVLSAVTNMSGAILAPLLGIAGDRWGHLRMLILPIIGIFGFYGALVICPGVSLLPIIYSFYGLNYGTFSLLAALLSFHIPKEQQPNAYGLLAAAGRLLSPIAPIIGGISYTISPALPLIITALLLPIPLSFLFLTYWVQHTGLKQKE